MASIRKKAIDRFSALGFPTIRQEEWKYTNIEPITRRTFHFSFDDSRDTLTLQKIEPFLFKKKDWTQLVFINGLYAKTLSWIAPEAADLKVGGLEETLRSDNGFLETYLGKVVPYENNAFIALNTAFLRDGALIRFPSDKVMSKPIHLLFISNAKEGETLSQPHNIILVGSGSRATVIESYVSLDKNSNFTNAVTEIILEEKASLDHYKIQKEDENTFHISATQAVLNRDSRYFSFSFSMGGLLTRNDLNVEFQGEGAECVLNGLYLTHDKQHVDNHTIIDHARTRGTSRQLYKGILDDCSKGVFSGKIFVRKDSQKTDAHQTNKNLLLSDGAIADTKPQLEIFADDVKCTHGAAVGQLDQEAIFYLKSRGMGEDQAKRLLTYGFASEVIERITLEPLRLELDYLLLERLHLNREASTGAR